ncbi:hypothetical protein [Flavobacterium sp.]|jgi:hypothetical protein|uniref:hypothetical protein n=1 Tax=Flavobacterium sp. TaxID=239 RepID=UPI0037BFAC18
MKKIKFFIIVLLFSSYNILSQAFDPNANRNGGVNRNIGRTYTPPSQPSAYEIEKKKTEQLDKFMDKLKKELTLDELQTIAIRNEIDKNNRNIDIIVKKEISDDEKSKEITSMMERTDKTVNSYLNKEQKEKYKILIEDSKPKKKEKKQKKEETAVEEIKKDELKTED